MSKGSSGLFSGTKGSNHGIRVACHSHVMMWAESKRKELTGKAKKSFNTACVAYDDATGRYYYGRNGGYREDGYVKNPILFGDSTHKGLLPETSFNKYPVGNCAEVDAVNRALNAGADLSHLHILTIHTTQRQFGEVKPSCENCTYTFRGRVRENYSGWQEGAHSHE